MLHQKYWDQERHGSSVRAKKKASVRKPQHIISRRQQLLLRNGWE